MSWFKIKYFRSVKKRKIKCCHKSPKCWFRWVLKLNILLLLTVFVPEQFVPWAFWYFNILHWFHNSGVSHGLEVPREGEGKAEQKDWFNQTSVIWKLSISLRSSGVPLQALTKGGTSRRWFVHAEVVEHGLSFSMGTEMTISIFIDGKERQHYYIRWAALYKRTRSNT